MTLYINNEFCESIEQLKGYFDEDILPSVEEDLIQLGKNGVLSDWLRNISENNLADKVDSLDEDLGDFEYKQQLSQIFTGKDITIEKPLFDKCFKLEEKCLKMNEDDKLYVHLSFRVLKSLNENYIFYVSCPMKGSNPSNPHITNGVKSVFDRTSHNEKYKINSIYNEIGEKIEIDIPIFYDFSDGFRRILVKTETNEVLCEFPELYIRNIVSKKIKDISKIFDDSGIRFKSSEKFCKTIYINNVPIIMRLIQRGHYKMERFIKHKRDYVEIDIKEFYIMDTIVTQELWEAVMHNNPSQFKGLYRPVTNVSYKDCIDFIGKLNSMLKEISINESFTFKLPSEMEWEFAAKGGINDKGFTYSGGNRLNDLGWYKENSNSQTHDVKTKLPNRLKLYDMSGNVWEWCRTENKPEIYKTDGEDRRRWKITRGGCAASDADSCKITKRFACDPSHKSPYLGFRLIMKKKDC